MGNRQKRLQELRDLLRMSRTALYPAPITDTFRGANQVGQHYSLSGVDA